MNKNEAGEELKPGDEGYEADETVEETEEEGEEGKESEDDEPKDKTEKSVETPEAKRARLKRQLEQLDKKYPDLADKTNKVEKKSSKKSDEFDYGEKAFLISNGIKESDEMELVKEVMKESGKSLDEVIGSKFFQAELKERRDEKATADATPKGSKRSGQSAANTVEYWIAKGELPPKDQRELRQKVVNARIKNETDTNVFTKTPVASNK